MSVKGAAISDSLTDMGMSSSSPFRSTIYSSVNDAGVMEISLLKVLVNVISSFLHLSFSGNGNSEFVSKYYKRVEGTLKLLKPIADALVDSEVASDEVLSKAFEAESQAVDELRELFENWHPLSSKVYFVSLCKKYVKS